MQRACGKRLIDEGEGVEGERREKGQCSLRVIQRGTKVKNRV